MSIVQMSRLGAPGYGRFANQLFQSAFVHTYARRLGAQAQLPPWVGDQLFGRHASDISCKLPIFRERYDPVQLKPGRFLEHSSYPHPPWHEAIDHDYVGWAQFHTDWYRPDQEFIRSLFKPLPEIEKRFDVAASTTAGRTLVGLHLRRGDYGQFIFYITPVEWYLRLLEQLWPTLENPMLFIATEDMSLVSAFAKYEPETSYTLSIERRFEPLERYNYLKRDLETKDPIQLDFYPDFYLLSKCDIIIGPNSTFSFAAAMLNTNLRAYYRSHLPTQKFEWLDPWNAHPLTHDDVRDYPNVPGISVAESPYWR